MKHTCVWSLEYVWEKHWDTWSWLLDPLESRQQVYVLQSLPETKSGCREIIGRRRQDCRNEIGSICNVFFVSPPVGWKTLLNNLHVFKACRMHCGSRVSHPGRCRHRIPCCREVINHAWLQHKSGFGSLVISPVCSFCWSTAHQRHKDRLTNGMRYLDWFWILANLGAEMI